MQTTDASNFFRSEADLLAEDARNQKALLTKDVGNPIELKGKVIRLAVRNSEAWTAESGAVIRRTDLVTGKTLQVFKGHTGPVTCLSFFKAGESDILLSGSWDQTIKAWDIKAGTLISTTKAHSDFLKCLTVIPHLNLLLSGSSDKHIKLWDLTTPTAPLPLIGSQTAHTRPVECISFDGQRVYTADSMGVIKIWDVETHSAPTSSRRLIAVSGADLTSHTTGVSDMWAAHGRVWSASADKTVCVQSSSSSSLIPHPVHVRSLLPVHLTPAAVPVLLTGGSDGAIRVWDLPHEDNPEMIDGKGASESEVVDVHSHDVTALALWIRDPETEKGKTVEAGLGVVKIAEAWVVSASLDGTLRRWRLSDLVEGKYGVKVVAHTKDNPEKPKGFEMSEEEERELAELMSDEDV